MVVKRLPSRSRLEELKLDKDVARYMLDRGIPLPSAPPAIITPSPSRLKGAVFNPQRVDKVLRAFMAMRHTQGSLAGTPLRPDPWQIAYIIAPTFGWVKLNEHGVWVRVVRKLYVDVPRKNGKTTLCGGLALYLLGADGEQGAQIYAAATKRDQASKLFDPVKYIAESTPLLRKNFKTRQGRILHPASNSYFKVEANDADGLHGANVHGAIIDELHVHKSPDLLKALETGVGSRQQPLIVVITTADDGKAETVYAHRRETIEQLARGGIEDPSYYGVIWAATEEDDPFAESTWQLANPGFPISPTRDFMVNAATEAKNSPFEFAEFQRLHLGIRTHQQSRYFEMVDWDNSAGPSWTEEELEGQWCYGGLDLAFSNDLCALAWVFPQEGGTFKVLWRMWTPEANLPRLDKVTSGAASVWARDGLLRITPGNVVDFDKMEFDIKADVERFAVADIAYDRWNASPLVSKLTAYGIPMTPIGMGWATMSPLVKELQRVVRLGLLHHNGNACVRWQADCFAVHQDPAGNVKPDRAAVAASKGKMDAIVATLMGFDKILRETVYEPTEITADDIEWY